MINLLSKTDKTYFFRCSDLIIRFKTGNLVGLLEESQKITNSIQSLIVLPGYKQVPWPIYHPIIANTAKTSNSQSKEVNMKCFQKLVSDFILKSFKGSSGPSHFIFEINVGKGRIRHRTTLKLKDELLNRLKFDFHSNWESCYVRSASFRHWFQN